MGALALLVAQDGDLDSDEWPLEKSAVDALSRAGLTEQFGARITLRRRTDLVLLRELVGASALRAAHRKVAQRMSARSPLAPELTRHLVLAGALEEAEDAFLSAATSSPPTRELLEAAEPLTRETERVDVLSALATLSLGCGEPGRALTLCARALAHGSSVETRSRTRLLGADVYLKLGRAARASRLLTRVEPQVRGTSDEARLCELWARVHIQSGTFVEAEARARTGLALSPDDPLLAAALEEALGAACSHRDERERAEEHFTRALALLGPDASPRALCRIASHRAIVHFRAGAILAAAERYREALRIAEAHELDDLMAVGSLNLGTAEHQGGELGSALRSYERGLDLARALGRKSTELTLRYNLANLYSELGAFERAESMLSELLARCGTALLGHFSAPVALLRAELCLHKGELGACQTELDRARAAFESRDRKRELVETNVVTSELQLAEGRTTEALESARNASAAARELGADDLVARALLAQGRALLASNGDNPLAALEEAQRLARASGLRLLDVQVEPELFRAHQLAHQPQKAASHAERARRLWDRMAGNLPSQMRELFWRHPRRSKSDVTQTFAASFRDTSTEVQTLRRLLSVNKRLNSALTVERVLDAALDAALELTLAERAFLMLREPGEVEGAEARIVVARHSGGSLSKLERPSQSIVMQALTNEVPVLTTDALRDPRFSSQRSVHAMRLKSVLCVPISTPQGVLGALYVDNRVERGLFSEASREVLMTLADQVAIALENARLHDQLEARTRELADQKRAVERLSRGQARAIVQLERELASQKEVLGTRFDYAQIAGRGAAMRAVLSKLDRVTDADINVLVRGASGTGKELVARALHYNGSRKQGPFIAVNCAALPENLLESELFGHVKGAFTGADRDKQGLMLAASGGTLFLDELGEMPLSTQAKLLRVLQEREVRPVGATRVEKLDVRLVCATNRDLQSDVASGAFREDLYYRVAVVEVTLPALRERTEDIADIARAILTRLAREKNAPAPELTREALRALMAHPWPGNVRELENALTRAYVLSDRSRITPSELDLAAAKRPLHATNRAQYRTEERERIFDALRSSGWNVSHVSRALGIPRNTLYRKMRDHGIEKSR
jgi:transcriptional regulator with GAF, ATPase, and Fis domain/tetratricopeptide (TPR) repeat protein